MKLYPELKKNQFNLYFSKNDYIYYSVDTRVWNNDCHTPSRKAMIWSGATGSSVYIIIFNLTWLQKNSLGGQGGKPKKKYTPSTNWNKTKLTNKTPTNKIPQHPQIEKL